MRNFHFVCLLAFSSFVINAHADTPDSYSAEDGEHECELTKEQVKWTEFLSDLVSEAIEKDLDQENEDQPAGTSAKIIIRMLLRTLKSILSKENMENKTAELSKRVREAIKKGRKSFVARHAELDGFYACIAEYDNVVKKDSRTMLAHFSKCLEKSFDFRDLARNTLLFGETFTNIKKTIKAKLEEIAKR